MRCFAMLSILAFLLGCGGGDGGNDLGSSGLFSCDVTEGSTHTCLDYDWTGGSYPTTAWSSACSQSGGTSGSGCSRSGAVGGCKVTMATGAITIHTTTWLFSGQASQYMAACAQSGGTFVTP